MLKKMPGNQEVMETWFRRVWAEEDPKAVGELLISDGPVRGLGANTMLSPDDFRMFQSALLALLSEVKITIDKGFDCGEWYSMLCSLTAKNRKTGEPITITGSATVRIEEGIIREAYNHWDFIALYEQLGLFPEHSFITALSGNAIFETLRLDFID